MSVPNPRLRRACWPSTLRPIGAVGHLLIYFYAPSKLKPCAQWLRLTPYSIQIMARASSR